MEHYEKLMLNIYGAEMNTYFEKRLYFLVDREDLDISLRTFYKTRTGWEYTVCCGCRRIPWARVVRDWRPASASQRTQSLGMYTSKGILYLKRADGHAPWIHTSVWFKEIKDVYWWSNKISLYASTYFW